MEAQRITPGGSKEVTYTGVPIGLDRSDSEVIKLIVYAVGETLIFPLTPEGAQALGRELSAPSVIKPRETQFGGYKL